MKNNLPDLIEAALNGAASLSSSTLCFTAGERKMLTAHSTRLELRKNDFLIEAGERRSVVCFVENGLLRYWMPDKGEKEEITFQFAREGEFAASSFLFVDVGNSSFSLCRNVRSSCNIQALYNTAVWTLERDVLLTLFQQSLNVNRMARLFLERVLARKAVRELCLLRLSPEERYRELLKKEHDLLEHVPLKYIASYLGIAPQTLCRIRKQMLFNEI